MPGQLNSGQGTCRATHRLLIRPVLAAISLGATPDVMNNALVAIHHINRHGRIDDFIAVALPLMGRHKSRMSTGVELEAVGSAEVLASLAGSDVISMMKRRGMLKQVEISPVLVDIGDLGTAYVRDQTPEKHTAGWVRRTTARAARRGKELGKPVVVRPYEAGDLVTLAYRNAILHIGERFAVYQGSPVSVNTYGFSAASTPSILPVMPHPDKIRDVE